MQNSQQPISEAEAARILALAAQLHAQSQWSYSVEELIQAGEEVNIPAANIHQALAQVRRAATPDAVVSSAPKHSSFAKPPQNRYLLPLLGTVTGLIISVPLLFATGSLIWSVKYWVNDTFFKSQLEGRLIDSIEVGGIGLTILFPPAVGLSVGIWGDRYLQKRQKYKQLKQEKH